jgi:hypothetical protein
LMPVYRIHLSFSLLQEAIKCMRHAKRTVLTTDDVESALSLRNVEVSLLIIIGFQDNNIAGVVGPTSTVGVKKLSSFFSSEPGAAIGKVEFCAADGLSINCIFSIIC